MASLRNEIKIWRWQKLTTNFAIIKALYLFVKAFLQPLEVIFFNINSIDWESIPIKNYGTTIYALFY